MDSFELVALLKQNKEEGLSYLYDKYAAALNGIIVRIVTSEPKAEEILQQTFLKIAYTIDSYDKESLSLFTWISRIARQEAISACQMNERIPGYNHPENQPLHQLVSGIAPEDKVVLDHIYLFGYSPLETAARLNIPLDTVKTRLRMAVTQMRKIVQQDPGYLLHQTLFITLYLSAVS